MKNIFLPTIQGPDMKNIFLPTTQGPGMKIYFVKVKIYRPNIYKI